MTNELQVYRRWPIRMDLEIPQGSEFIRTLGLFYRDPDGTSNLLDTTGYGVRWQIRETVGSGTKIFDGSTGNGRAVVGIQGGTDHQWNLLLRIPASQTQQFPAGLFGLYDLELIPPGAPDSTRRLLYGTVDVPGEVTR